LINPGEGLSAKARRFTCLLCFSLAAAIALMLIRSTTRAFVHFTQQRLKASLNWRIVASVELTAANRSTLHPDKATAKIELPAVEA
jgi:hypothetical protein